MKNQKVSEIISILKSLYSDAVCSLETGSPLQLLIATRLSAQCTDARVNLVTPVLFKRFPDVDAFAGADVSDIEEIIRSCGLYITKARDIRDMCAMLNERYGGKVPDTIEALTELPGVGRKTANLIVGEVFGKPAIIADTHTIRLSNRLGLAAGKDAYKVEKSLKSLIPPEEQTKFCHRLVLHGRAVCKAQKPDCANCALNKICPSSSK